MSPTYFVRTLLLLSSCGLAASQGACVTGSGTMKTETRTLPPFTSIDLSSSVDVEVAIGPTQSVTVEGEDNLIDRITTEVKDGRLVVDVKKGKALTTSKPMIVHVTVPALTAVIANASGDVYSKGTITGDALEISVDGSGDATMDVKVRKLTTISDGSGDIEVTGTADEHISTLDGSGDMDASKLVAKKCTIEVNGSGNASVDATDELHARTQGSGDLEYRGTPKIADIETHGSGDVTHAQ